MLYVVEELTDFIKAEPTVVVGEVTYTQRSTGAVNKKLYIGEERLQVMLNGTCKLSQLLDDSWDSKMLITVDEETATHLNSLGDYVSSKLPGDGILKPISWKPNEKSKWKLKPRLVYRKQDRELFANVFRVDGGEDVVTVDDLPKLFKGGVVIEVESLYVKQPKQRSSEVSINFKVVSIEIERELFPKEDISPFAKMREAGRYKQGELIKEMLKDTDTNDLW